MTDPSGGAVGTPGQRSDAILLMQVPATLDRAYIISIPRDAYVEIPGRGKDKINSAFEGKNGGAPLLIKTIGELGGGLRVDWPIIIDFAGLKGITDAVGGVDVNVDKTVTDPRSKRTFKAGVNHLNGREALDFVRQRYALPGSDYDRQKRQQQYLRALATKVVSSGLNNPTKLPRLLSEVTKSLTVDNAMPVQDMALRLSDVQPGSVYFYTLPMYTEQTGPSSWIEHVNAPETDQMFAALRDDTMDQYLMGHPPNDVTHVR